MTMAAEDTPSAAMHVDAPPAPSQDWDELPGLPPID